MIKSITLWDEEKGGNGFILQHNDISPKKLSNTRLGGVPCQKK